MRAAEQNGLNTLGLGTAVPAATASGLQISTPGDSHEREADDLAAQVVSRTETASPPVRATPAGGVQTKTSSAAPIADVLRDGGQPLPANVREFFEPRFGHDFAGVRVHTDDRAASTAGALGADAYTVGHHVVFGAQRFAPTTPPGQWLLAHELSHVLQQNAGSAFVYAR